MRDYMFINKNIVCAGLICELLLLGPYAFENYPLKLDQPVFHLYMKLISHILSTSL